MVWYAVSVLLTLLLDVFSGRSHQADKDLEILALKQQLRILEHKLGHQPRLSRWEKCVLAVVVVKLLHQTGKARQHLASLLLFKPETVCSNGIKRWFDASGRFSHPGVWADPRLIPTCASWSFVWPGRTIGVTTRSRANCRSWAIRWTEPQSRIF
jgi:hypothetical protein